MLERPASRFRKPSAWHPAAAQQMQALISSALLTSLPALVDSFLPYQEKHILEGLWEDRWKPMRASSYVLVRHSSDEWGQCSLHIRKGSPSRTSAGVSPPVQILKPIRERRRGDQLLTQRRNRGLHNLGVPPGAPNPQRCRLESNSI